LILENVIEPIGNSLLKILVSGNGGIEKVCRQAQNGSIKISLRIINFAPGRAQDLPHHTSQHISQSMPVDPSTAKALHMDVAACKS
jgi:hypothetical protein